MLINLTTILALLFAICTFSIAQNGTPKSTRKKCHGIPIKKMNKFSYKSALSNNSKEKDKVIIKIAEEPMFNDNWVYVGYTGSESESVNSAFLPVDKCIAIKIYKNEKYPKKSYENAIKILNRLKEDEMNKHEHIIDLFDHGQIIEEGKNKLNFVAIYELRHTTFENELYFGDTYQKIARTKIGNSIKEIMMPLEDLHRVAVHMHFNPENLVVPNKNISVRRLFSKVENTPLKLIGLEGAFFLEMWRNIEKINDDEIEGHHQFSQTANGRYMAPEYLDKKISTKLDIWSAGIVIYELLLVNYFNQNSIFEKITNPQKKKKTTKEQIDKIAEFYRGFLITNQPEKNSECDGAQIGLMKNNTAELPNVGTAQWWNRYEEVVQIILEIWCQQNMPEIVFLLTTINYRIISNYTPLRDYFATTPEGGEIIGDWAINRDLWIISENTNMLGVDPTKRMSASEILDFLDGKCAPKIENVDKMSFFGTVDADFLIGSVEMEILITNKFFDEKRYELLKGRRSMLEKVKKNQKELLSTLAKRKHCNGQ